MAPKQVNPGVIWALKYLASVYPTLPVEHDTVEAWNDALGHHDSERIAEAARWVSRTHRYGAPSPSHLAEYLEGRRERVRVPVTDLWNRKILGRDGNPTYELEERLVFPDGSSLPVAIEGPDRDRQAEDTLAARALASLGSSPATLQALGLRPGSGPAEPDPPPASAPADTDSAR